jgi:pSer/pThr/pTyr-binding forkhead associated (FHA) protein
LFDGGREDNTPSRNGVFVNGQRVKEHILKPGDVIHFGPGIRATFYPVIRPVSSDAKSEGSSEETELEHLQDPDPSGTESGS